MNVNTCPVCNILPLDMFCEGKIRGIQCEDCGVLVSWDEDDPDDCGGSTTNVPVTPVVPPLSSAACLGLPLSF